MIKDGYKIKDILAIITAELSYLEMAESIGIDASYSKLFSAFHTFCIDKYPPHRNIREAAPEGQSVDDLCLSVRTSNALLKMNIHSIEDAMKVSDSELLSLESFGRKSLKELRTVLAEFKSDHTGILK